LTNRQAYSAEVFITHVKNLQHRPANVKYGDRRVIKSAYCLFPTIKINWIEQFSIFSNYFNSDKELSTKEGEEERRRGGEEERRRGGYCIGKKLGISMYKLMLTGRNLYRVFHCRFGHTCMSHAIVHITKQLNLKSKTQPKQLLGSLPSAFVLPGMREGKKEREGGRKGQSFYTALNISM
jgi:hypothetical protein